MGSPFVYDKAKYHLESVEEFGLEEEQSCVHIALYLQWIMDKELYSEEFSEQTDEFRQFRNTPVTALEIAYEGWDGCLIDDMLNEEGNAFSAIYFEQQYYEDVGAVAEGLPSVYHLEFRQDNYLKLQPLIDKAYAEWKLKQAVDATPTAPASQPKPWWKLW
ncbi:MAG: hypothetical protein ACAI35_03255 [Candidatus Methylacidiphilales bacterium]|nr:hypothetical protein [Candidatus Methylacidiphilales bacterium]